MKHSRSHRKKVKHYHRPGDLHELTISCYRRLPLLTNDQWRKSLAESIDSACRIDYLHENPVRRGLCWRAVEWKWSSALWYLGEPPRRQLADLPLIHGLRPGTLER